MTQTTKLADVVAGQLPNFVQDEYATFVAFLEAYYTFLDQQKLTRSLEYIKDVDKTIDEFINYIRKEIAPEIPENNLPYLQNAKHTQLSKGSEESYKTLFRLLFKKEITIEYPAEKMLRVSGGEWEQDISFFLKVTSGDVFSLQNNFLYIECVKKQTPHRHRVYVKKIQKVETTVDVYEIFIAKNFYGIMEIGDLVNYNGVKGIVEPTTSKIKIIQAGTGFKSGQVFNISTSTASGLLVKVVKTTEEGGLKQLQIISFGTGFKKDFYYDLGQPQIISSATTVSDKNVQSLDAISSGTDAGVINKVNYHSDYAQGSYVGEVLADFYTRNITEDSSVISARVLVQLGAINRYPGYYKSSNSLVDDDSYIQDGEFYQDFSYIIKIDEKLSTYKDAVLSTLHPVGRKLFGEYRIESDFELNLEISNPIIRILIPFLPEHDETVRSLDRNVFAVKNLHYTGDGQTRVFDFYEEEGVQVLPLYVKLNGVIIEKYEDWDIGNNTLLFADAPAVGVIIEFRYAVLNASGSSALYSAFFDISKSLLSPPVTSIDTAPTQIFRKALSPQYGYNSFAFLGGLTQDEETDIRANSTVKLLPSLETLSSDVAAIEKDTLTIGDTGTDENGDANTSLVIRNVSKPLASSIGSFLENTRFSIAKPLASPPVLSADLAPTQFFTKRLSPEYGYDSFVTLGGLTQDSETDVKVNAATKLLPSLEILASNVDAIEKDTLTLVDGQLAFGVIKSVLSKLSAVNDNTAFALEKLLRDSYSTQDSSAKTIYKYVIDSISIDDIIADIMQAYEFSDYLEIVEKIESIYSNRESFIEIANAKDLSSVSLSKQFDDTYSINSTGYVQVNPYSSEVYFAEAYTTGRTLFTQ